MITLTPFQQKDFDRLIRWIENPELLITIAGPAWSYPLTVVQLQRYLDDPKSHSFNIVETPQDIVIGHAEIILLMMAPVKSTNCWWIHLIAAKVFVRL